MAADTTVKYLHSAMVGAPVLTGAAGSLIAVLDACLVNGFASGTLDSLVVAGGIATATRAAGHSMEVGSVVLVAGVTGGMTLATNLNGQKRVLSKSATQFTFDATGIANGTATGTITQKLAPCGWGKFAAGTNLAVYTHLLGDFPEATGKYLRVDDTSTTVVRVRGYDSMVDTSIATATGPFPTVALMADPGLYWPKAQAAGATVRPWIIVGDGRAFYLHVLPGTNGFSGWGVFFGDYIRESSTDQYACGLLAGHTDQNNYGANSATGDFGSLSTSYANLSAVSTTGGIHSARDFTGVGNAVINALIPEANAAGFAGSGSGPFGWPSSISNRLTISRVLVASGAVRGVMPGLRFIMTNVSTANVIAHKEVLTGFDGDMTGRSLLNLRTGSLTGSVTAASNHALIDITGPWR